jgi:hypothetical protein
VLLSSFYSFSTHYARSAANVEKMHDCLYQADNLQLVQWCLEFFSRETSFMIIPHRVIFYMRRAVRKGLVNIAQALFNHIPCTYSIKPDVLLMACQYDCDIEIFDWAKQQKDRFEWNLQLLGYSAIFHDRYDIMLWIHKNFPPHECWNWESLYFAAEVGNVAILDWLLSYVPELRENQYELCTTTQKGAGQDPFGIGSLKTIT